MNQLRPNWLCALNIFKVYLNRSLGHVSSPHLTQTCVESTQPASPRKLESVWGNKGFTESELHLMFFLSVLLSSCAAFLQAVYSLSSVVAFLLFPKTSPSGFYSVHPFLSDLPSSPQILFRSLPNSPYFDPPVKVGQPCCSCLLVLGIHFAIAGYSAHMQPVTTVGPVSWRSWDAAKPGTTDFLLSIDS